MSDGVRKIPIELLSEYPRRLALPVQWGDMDALGHVNNVVFFRWIESSRIDLLDGIGLFESAQTTGIGPILASVQCDYRRQLHFPDTVHVGCRVEKLGRSSIKLKHAIVSEQQGELVAEGSATIVVFDYRSGSSVALSDDLRQKLAAVMQGGEGLS